MAAALISLLSLLPDGLSLSLSIYIYIVAFLSFFSASPLHLSLPLSLLLPDPLRDGESVGEGGRESRERKGEIDREEQKRTMGDRVRD